MSNPERRRLRAREPPIDRVHFEDYTQFRPPMLAVDCDFLSVACLGLCILARLIASGVGAENYHMGIICHPTICHLKILRGFGLAGVLPIVRDN